MWNTFDAQERCTRGPLSAKINTFPKVLVSFFFFFRQKQMFKSKFHNQRITPTDILNYCLLISAGRHLSHSFHPKKHWHEKGWKME